MIINKNGVTYQHDFMVGCKHPTWSSEYNKEYKEKYREENRRKVLAAEADARERRRVAIRENANLSTQNVSDSYVKQLLRQQFGILSEDCTIAMIEAKRQDILTKRLMAKLRKGARK